MCPLFNKIAGHLRAGHINCYRQATCIKGNTQLTMVIKDLAKTFGQLRTRGYILDFEKAFDTPLMNF